MGLKEECSKMMEAVTESRQLIEELEKQNIEQKDEIKRIRLLNEELQKFALEKYNLMEGLFNYKAFLKKINLAF